MKTDNRPPFNGNRHLRVIRQRLRIHLQKYQPTLAKDKWRGRAIHEIGKESYKDSADGTEALAGRTSKVLA